MLKPTSVLTKRQLSFLDVFSDSPFVKKFYLTGGTALCGFYIPYRYSEDLDFFSPDEVDSKAIIVWLKSKKTRLGYRSLDVQTTFNRNLIFLQFDKETLKTEFTYYPFSAKSNNKYKQITVDSLEDIALNKLFTIYQNPRLRDYMDLYMILTKDGFRLSQLRADAKIKFDWNIDAIQLGTQLLKVKEEKDVPKVVGKFDFDKMEEFYVTCVKEMKSEIIDK
mgnify:FL=1